MPSIFITGGAQGIGLATAEHFWSKGWFVGVFDLNGDATNAWANDKGERAFGGALDVTDVAAWGPAIQSFLEASNNSFDVLLNNAGILADGLFEKIPLEKQHAIIDVNVKGLMNGCYLAKPHLKSGARVINLCSASALYGAPMLATYSSSKFAVRGLTEALRIEWSGDGVLVTDIMPIFVRTAMVGGMTKVEATKKLGVHITAEQVAATIWKAATDARPKVHYPMGGQTHQLRWANRLLPESLVSMVFGKISGF